MLGHIQHREKDELPSQNSSVEGMCYAMREQLVKRYAFYRVKCAQLFAWPQGG